jgi:hypothetical protein
MDETLVYKISEDLAKIISQSSSLNWYPHKANVGERSEGKMVVVQMHTSKIIDSWTNLPSILDIDVCYQPFVLKVRQSTPNVRKQAWDALDDFLPTDISKYRYHIPLFVSGTPGYNHLKRKDRFRIVTFCFANGISPHVLREWLWASGLLQTFDPIKTQKRWKHVEELFVACEEGKIKENFTVWDMYAHCHNGSKCQCQTTGRKVSIKTGEIINKNTLNTSQFM